MAHTSSGVTAVNLFTGAKLFSLPLSPNSGASGGQNGPSVWSDINGDDVIEHIKVLNNNKYLRGLLASTELYNSGGGEK